MNLERMKLLRDYLAEVPEDHIDMNHWCRTNGQVKSRANQVPPAEDLKHTCGTSACIAGWTVALFDPESDVEVSVSSRAAYLLSLTPNEKVYLFNGYSEDWEQEIDLDKITKDQVLRALDISIERGHVTPSVFTL